MPKRASSQPHPSRTTKEQPQPSSHGERASTQWPWIKRLPRSSPIPREQEELQTRTRLATAPISHTPHHLFAPRRNLTPKPALTTRHPPNLTFPQAAHKQLFPEHHCTSTTYSPHGSTQQPPPTTQPPQLTFLQAPLKQLLPEHHSSSPTCSPPGTNQQPLTPRPSCPAASTAPETPPPLCPSRQAKT